jgi:bacteriochlorophyllide a dehydrogenase
MKAHAVVFTAPNKVEYTEVNCPDPGPDDVVVRVTHSWISNGTEGSYLRGERIAGDTPYCAGDPWPFPIVSGYQKIGVVEWVGANISDLKIGETVFAAFGKIDGMFEPRGGQVSPSVSPRDQIWKLPPGVDPLAFSGLVLAQVGYNAGTRGALKIGDGAIVIGDGLVGQWTAQTLSRRGANVLMIGKHHDRLAKFAGGPLRRTLNANQCDWLQEAQKIFPNGAQISVDTVGSVKVIDELFTLMRRGGHLVSAGFFGTEDRVALQPLRYRELALELVSGWVKARMDHTIAMIAAGNLDTLSLITHHFPVAQAAAAWRLIETKREPVLGVILDWP